MRVEEYEIRRLRNDIKQVMVEVGQSSAVAISGLLAARLYDMGWRRQKFESSINSQGTQNRYLQLERRT